MSGADSTTRVSDGNINTARVTFVHRGLWRATIGPLDDRGRSRVEAYGLTPWAR